MLGREKVPVPMNRRQSLFGFALLGAGALFRHRASACAWDSDTLRDESRLNGTDFDLITGQFPHHGSAYYQARVKRLTAAGEPADYQSRNDLAVAYLRLERWKESQALLDKNLRAKPGDYFTLSNLGVLAKKQGEYAKAAEWMAQAIAIKPEGHMGLGDWYVKSLQFRTELAAHPKTVPDKNFLGIPYAGSFNPVYSAESLPPDSKPFLGMPFAEMREKLRRLLENDQSFSDGFLLMGDHLAASRDLSLALLSYRRAALLGHSNRTELSRRITTLNRELCELGYDSNRTNYRTHMKAKRADLEKLINKALTGAAEWLESFRKVEGEMVAKSGDENLTPEMVEAEMAKRGIKRYRP